MNKLEIEKIIVKFLDKEANAEELEKLDFWLKNGQNIPSFNHFVKTEYLTTICMSGYNVKKAKESIHIRRKNIDKKRKIRRYSVISIAASIVLIVGLSFFQMTNKKEVVTIVNTIDIGSNKAVLTLDNGNQISLEEGVDYEGGNVSSTGEFLLYDQKSERKNELKYNYLTIPRGGKFLVQLSDGTKVWLNSDSKLKYPVRFMEGKIREVELVYGEAYFEVSPSTAHSGAPFHVFTKNQEINVLGTKFNVKAYTDDNMIVTTLVEGKVQVRTGAEKKILKPNQQSRINVASNGITVKEVDVSQEISWINGMFTFNEASLEEMMKVLSRWYDAEVVFESAELKKYVFTGILERTKSVEDILKFIEATSEGEVVFEVKNKTITIK